MWIWVFVYVGIGKDDLSACMWWCGGETLSPNICIVLGPAEKTIFALLPS